MVREYFDKNYLILLNLYDRCDGEVTWEQRNMKSTIDFVLVNSKYMTALTV